MIPTYEIFKTFPGYMRSYILKENHIGSEVSEILRYKQKKGLLNTLYNRIGLINLLL